MAKEKQTEIISKVINSYSDKIGTGLHRPLVSSETDDYKNRAMLLKMIDEIQDFIDSIDDIEGAMDDSMLTHKLRNLHYVRDTAIASCNAIDSTTVDWYKKEELYHLLIITVLDELTFGNKAKIYSTMIALTFMDSLKSAARISVLGTVAWVITSLISMWITDMPPEVSSYLGFVISLFISAIIVANGFTIYNANKALKFIYEIKEENGGD